MEHSAVSVKTISGDERKERIVDLLAKRRRVSVIELAQHFRVSEVTVRAYLRQLEEEGQLRRVRGGAIIPSRARFEPSWQEKEDEHADEKERIAEAAAALIGDGEAVILDAGSTTLRVARRLVHRHELTVVVNDLAIAEVLAAAKNIQVVMIGGILRSSVGSVVGPIAVDVLRRFHADRLVLGANGVSLSKGITTPDLTQAETKRAMIEAAEEVILVADSSKIGVSSFAHVAPVSVIDRLVTDSGISPEDVKAFKDQEVEVITT